MIEIANLNTKSIEERNKILRSPAFLKQMSRMFRGLVGRRIECLFIPNGSDDLAYTNGLVTYINPTHRFFDKLDAKGVMTALVGLRLHELLHPKYTDTRCQKQIIAMRDYEPVKPLLVKKRNELTEEEVDAFEPLAIEELSTDEYLVIPDLVEKTKGEEKAYLDLYKSVVKSIWNTIEDGRIERIGTFEFPGVAYSLYFVNRVIVENAKQKEKESEEEEEEEEEDAKKVLNELHHLIWSKALLNANVHCPSDLEHIWAIIKPLVVKGRMSAVCQDCFNASKTITRIIMGLLPSPPEVQGLAKAQRERSKGEETATNNPMDDPSQVTNRGEITIESPQENDEGEGSPLDGLGMSDNTFGDDSSAEISSEEREKFSEMIEQGLQSLLNEIEREERDMERDVKEQNERLSSSFIRGGFSRYSRSPISLKGDERAKYYAIADAPKNKRIINRFIRQMKNILIFNQDEIERYETKGYIDSNCFGHLGSGAIFSKRITADEVNELNIFLDIDTSSSMLGEKERVALETAVILSEVCDALKIRLTIFGFGDNFSIYRFADGKSKSQKYNIAALKSAGGTPMLEMIKTNEVFCEHDGNNKLNIVFVITDGEPFNMSATGQAIRNLLKKGVEVFGLGIRCSEASMTELFGKNYIDVSDLSILPKTICGIVKRNLLKR